METLELPANIGILERGPAGATIHAHSAGSAISRSVFSDIPALQTLFSVDGRILACVHNSGVSVYDAKSFVPVLQIHTPGTVAVSFSTTGRFLCVLQKASNLGAGKEKNLTVWEVSSGAIAYDCFQKAFSKADWPTIQFSADDGIACRAVSNEVHFFFPPHFTTHHVRLRVEQVAKCKLSPCHHPVIASFAPTDQNQPGKVSLHGVPSAGTQGVVKQEPKVQKSIFRVQDIDFRWASDGSAVLIIASSDVDMTNQSYFGETNLHYARVDGRVNCKVGPGFRLKFFRELIFIHVHKLLASLVCIKTLFVIVCDFFIQVSLDKEGAVHEASWSPNSDEFVVVYGVMPAKATIFSALTCEPIYQLGSGPHNTVRWNPFGHMICLAGFGNLPGDLRFYDKKADGKYKLTGFARAACSVRSCYCKFIYFCVCHILIEHLNFILIDTL